MEARTIGAQVHTPELDPGRHWGVDPLFGLTAIGSYPYSGPAAMVYYDGGPLDYATPTHGTPAQTCTDENSATVHHGTAPGAVWWSCRPTRPACTAATRTSIRGARWTASTHDSHLAAAHGFINQCVTASVPPRPCYSNGYTGP